MRAFGCVVLARVSVPAGGRRDAKALQEKVERKAAEVAAAAAAAAAGGAWWPHWIPVVSHAIHARVERQVAGEVAAGEVAGVAPAAGAARESVECRAAGRVCQTTARVATAAIAWPSRARQRTQNYARF